MAGLKWGETIKIGLIAGIFAVAVSAIGMVEAFNGRDVIAKTLTFGQLLLFAASVGAGYLAARQSAETNPARQVLRGLVAGLVAGLPMALFIFLPIAWPSVRDSLVNVSPVLMEIITFGQLTVDQLRAYAIGSETITRATLISPAAVGALLQTLVTTILATLGALAYVLPVRFRRPVIMGIVVVLVAGTLSDVLVNLLRPLPRNVVNQILGAKGLTQRAAIILLLLVIALNYWWNRGGQKNVTAWRARTMPARGRSQQSRLVTTALVLAFLLILPRLLGSYLTDVMDTVGLFVLMGLGLNIVVGYAGLLDLGYVAFFAIGAYVMGLLTSGGQLGVADTGFWLALPICVLASTVAGVILGTPVLRMRGDYLAIVTLGFGEIIRVLANSDLLKPYIGGAQGILQIPKPEAFGETIVEPQHFYYILLAGCILAVFVSWKLRDARLGRRWMAMREDEDVAEAMGIHLVSTKLLAFGMGAAFAGLAGAIQAARLGSIFPHSFNLLISINVLSLIIVGGIGSLPGVVVGALVLVGLPEILREFTEYRLLIYGALLIAMMIARPEGLWPSPVRRRELHAEEHQPNELDAEREGVLEVRPDGAIGSD
jgi:branched-chain amino acid transport system permease protein